MRLGYSSGAFGFFFSFFHIRQDQFDNLGTGVIEWKMATPGLQAPGDEMTPQPSGGLRSRLSSERTADKAGED
jgi:hypothetical protein